MGVINASSLPAELALNAEGKGVRVMFGEGDFTLRGGVLGGRIEGRSSLLLRLA